MRVEKDVLIATRRDKRVAADIFRPDGPGEYPAIVTMSPYGKDVFWADRFPLYEQTDQGPHAVWETPYPDWWVERGFVVVRTDSPGTGKSTDAFDALGPIEVNGYYDAIEWTAAQPWCNGKIGAVGISWLAMLQWLVAAQQPPHLAAIIPWEGSTDPYREFLRHGGIADNRFVDFWWQLQIEPQLSDPTHSENVDLRAEMRLRPLIDDWYEERTPDLSQIQVPVLASANWGSLVLHHRGVLEAYQSVGSACRQLVITGGTHIGPFYEPWAKDRQLRFLDRWLNEEPNGAENDSPVQLAVRSCGSLSWREEWDWPLTRTNWTELCLDAETQQLLPSLRAEERSCSYKADDGSAAFSYVRRDDIEITGPVSLKLWVESDTDDADLFVRLQHFSPDGEEYMGVGPQGAPIPLALGWLRASHRKLDQARAVPHRPYHSHDERRPLKPGTPTLVEIELWPTCIVLPRGHRLVARISSNDSDMGILAHDEPSDRVTAGDITLHTGGRFASRLLLPIVPGA